MTRSSYSDADRSKALYTLQSIEETLLQLIEWNRHVSSANDYYETQSGMQLLAANCTLITAIGEGTNRINKILPDFLQHYFPNTPWRAIIGMRNQIAHGYFELDAELIFETVSSDILPLLDTIQAAIRILSSPQAHN